MQSYCLRRMKYMTRSQARENAFILIFEKTFNPENSFDDMKALAETSELFEIDDFTRLLYETTEEYSDKADELIAKYSKGWRVERLSKVVVSVLRLAVSEIVALDDIPASVSVNEAVELAKKYASSEDASFINGVLGSIIRGMTE